MSFAKWIFSFGFPPLCMLAYQCSVSVDSLCPFFLIKITVKDSRVQERWILYPTCFPLCVANTAQTAAIMVPYFAQWNVSMFSEWIQGWFVWISLISRSHLNYWCSSVRPAFPMTDGLCSQVIFLLCYSSLSSSFFSSPMTNCLSGERISISRFPSPCPPLSPPLSPPLYFLPSTALLCAPLWHFYMSFYISICHLVSCLKLFLIVPYFCPPSGPSLVLFAFFLSLRPNSCHFPDISEANFWASPIKSETSAGCFLVVVSIKFSMLFIKVIDTYSFGNVFLSFA